MMNGDQKEKVCPHWKKPCAEVQNCGWMIPVIGKHQTLGTPMQMEMCKLDAILTFVQQIAPVMQAMAQTQFNRNPSTGG